MRCKHSNIEEFFRDVNYIVKLAVRGRYLSREISSFSPKKRKGGNRGKNRKYFKMLEETSLNKKSLEDISNFAKIRESAECLKNIMMRRRTCENKFKSRNGKNSYSCDLTNSQY